MDFVGLSAIGKQKEMLYIVESKRPKSIGTYYEMTAMRLVVQHGY